MAQVTRAAFASALSTKINDNSAGEITAQDVREVLTDLEDSAVWWDEITDYQQKPAEGAFVDGDKTKLDYLTITQARDIDQMATDIAALANGMVYKGNWDASGGSFPSGADTGAFYTVTVAGTVDSVDFAVGDRLVAITDGASTTTYAANWSKLDATDAVQSVAGLIGSISAAALRTALNVEDGATADQTGAEMVSAIDAQLGGSSWQSGGGVQNNFAATVDPTVNDDTGDGYEVGSRWLNVSTSPVKEFRCDDASAGAAVWTRVLDGDTGDDATAKAAPVAGDKIVQLNSEDGDKPVISTWDQAISSRKLVTSDSSAVTGADQITNIMSLTQAEYDAIGTPDASTLYVISG